MKRIVCLLLTIVVVFSLCACNFQADDTRITMGVLEEAATFDPLYAQGDTENIIAANCFEGLVRLDREGKIDLGGATAYTVEKDGLTYTFKLNPSACWYVSAEAKKIAKELKVDLKSEITAQDYIFGIERYINANNTALNTASLKAIDDYTLEITLEKADPDFLYHLATKHIYPCNEAYVTALGEKYGSSPESMLFNGPYYPDSSSASEVVMVPNPDYNGKTQVLNGEVVLYFTGTAEKLTERLKNGTYDIMITPDSVKNAQPYAVDVTTTWGLSISNDSAVADRNKLYNILIGSTDLNSFYSMDASMVNAKRIIPDKFLINGNLFSDFVYSTLHTGTDDGNAVATLNRVLKEIKSTSLPITFALPAEYETVANTMVDGWESAFGERISVTVRTYDEKTDNSIDAILYDIALIPITPAEKTSYGVVKELNAKQLCSEKALNNLNEDAFTESKNAAHKISVIEETVYTSGAFVPLFHTGANLYTNNINGVYSADGGRLIYFHAGEKNNDEK